MDPHTTCLVPELVSERRRAKRCQEHTSRVQVARVFRATVLEVREEPLQQDGRSEGAQILKEKQTTGVPKQRPVQPVEGSDQRGPLAHRVSSFHVLIPLCAKSSVQGFGVLQIGARWEIRLLQTPLAITCSTMSALALKQQNRSSFAPGEETFEIDA